MAPSSVEVDVSDKLTQALLARVTDPKLRASILKKAADVAQKKKDIQSQVEKAIEELLSPLSMPVDSWDQTQIASQAGFRLRKLANAVGRFQELLAAEERELTAVQEALRIGPIAVSVVKRAQLKGSSP